MSSPASLSAASCSAADMMCDCRPARSALALPRRLGCRRSPMDRICWPAWRRATAALSRSAALGGSRELIRLWREISELVCPVPGGVDKTLTSLADGADLLITGAAILRTSLPMSRSITTFRWPRCISFCVRPNGQLLLVPAGAVGPLRVDGVLVAVLAHVRRSFEDAQRRELGLPKATGPWRDGSPNADRWKFRPMTRCAFPGWQPNGRNWDGQRPFIGTLTLELPTEADEEVASWIAAGTPPICFGFGSISIESPADTLAMIERGLRAVRRAGVDLRRRD